jgi:hypothetical protein
MLRRCLAAGTALLLTLLLGIGVSPAFAGVKCNEQGECDIEITQPGGDGSSGNADPVTGLTPGPSKCVTSGEKPREIPCSRNGGYWSPADSCYMSLADPQPAPPSGADAGKGAWYVCDPCTPAVGSGNTGDNPLCGVKVQTWRDTPPPGVNRLTPAQAAAALVASFQLKGIEIGKTPSDGRKGAVGLPVWLWVKNPGQLTWGPYTRSATLGGVTVSATASVRSVTWQMGDGESVTCGGPGTPYVKGMTGPSPTCGYKYALMSPGKGTQPYTITATSNWDVEWNAGGQGGVINTQTQATAQSVIGELQTVIVNP